MPGFSGSRTAEARERRRMYRAEISRAEEQAGFGADYLAFLRSCAMVLEIKKYTEDDALRVDELMQRTNQLNFSGRKYTRAELAEILANPELGKFVLRCSERYGSYGTIGFCLIRTSGHRLEIVDLMLSCRIQGRSIEQALFGHLLSHHSLPGADTILVQFRKTERNMPAQMVLDSLGFRTDGNEESGGMILKIESPMQCDFIDVRCSETVLRVPIALEREPQHV